MKIEDLGIKRDGFAGDLVKFRKEIMGWTQERLAREIGVTVRTIQRWEHGLAWPTGDRTIRALIQARFVS